MSFLDLYNAHYYTTVNGCLFQTWKMRNHFSCADTPRRLNLLLYLKDCKAVFRMVNGETFCASRGDIVYMPMGARYDLEITDRENEAAGTFGINFMLHNDDGESFVVSTKPLIFTVSNTSYFFDLFSRMSKISDARLTSNARLKSIFYEIVASLCETQGHSKVTEREFKIIEKGIAYLENDHKLEKSVAEISAMCSVSENYFRRLFKEYSGISPKEYILRARIDKAKLRLYEDNIPISEIAEICGFPDTAYFCRVFKKRTGLSPLSYRNSKTNIQQGE